MKTITSIFFASALALNAQTTDKYTQIIWQTEYLPDDSVAFEYPMTVPKNGVSPSLDPVTHKSVFVLYCINNENNHETEIATQTVSAYLPEASITLTSQDPYINPSDGSRRTRADQAYTATYTVSGLITNDPTVQAAARMVNFDSAITKLDALSLAIPSGSIPVSTHRLIEDNETKSSTHINQVSALETGLATFTISSLADFGATSSILGSPAKMYIFPTTSGSISNLDASRSYSSVPNIPLDIINAYPGSDNYLRVTRLSTNESFDINISNWNNSFDYSKHNTWTVMGDELDDHEAFNGDGQYLFEFITKTPFDEKVLDTKGPVILRSTIYIKAQLTSAEK